MNGTLTTKTLWKVKNFNKFLYIGDMLIIWINISYVYKMKYYPIISHLILFHIVNILFLLPLDLNYSETKKNKYHLLNATHLWLNITPSVM